MKKLSILVLICIALNSATEAKPLGKRNDLDRREIPPAKRFKTEHEEYENGFFGSSENEDANFFDLSYSSNSSTEQSLTRMELETPRRNPDNSSSLDQDPMSDEEELVAQIGNMNLQTDPRSNPSPGEIPSPKVFLTFF